MNIFWIVMLLPLAIGAIYGIRAEMYFFKGLTKKRRIELGIPTLLEIVATNPFTIFIFLLGWMLAGILFISGALFGSSPWGEKNKKYQGRSFIVANFRRLTMEDVDNLCIYYNMSEQESVEIKATVTIKKIAYKENK